jgi:hypothetical protein|tara:strand:+ start:16254 stop:17378 length:1125 start_codon:yes stop_codon:yes gene_type:complete
MNVNEMHLAIQQGVDKINSLQADLLLREEIDIELNKSQMRFINTKYGKNNKYRKGFEESQKRIDDLRSLVREYEAPTNYKEALGTKFHIDSFSLPYDYLYLVSTLTRSHINDNCTRITYDLEEAEPIQFFTMSLANVVLNGNTAIADSLVMFEDATNLTLGQAILWQNNNNYIFPQDSNAVREDIIQNPGIGFNIYWEQYGDLNYPGSFIIIPNPDVHPWLNWDGSIGTVTSLAHVDSAGTQFQNIGLQYSQAFLGAKRTLQDPTEVSSGSTFIQHDDIFTLLTDPFNTTKYTDPLYTIRGNALDLYTNDIFIIDAVKITYIRKPSKISLSLGISCELPEHCHQEIVDMTVASILEGIGDPRYSTQQIEVNKNE